MAEDWFTAAAAGAPAIENDMIAPIVALERHKMRLSDCNQELGTHGVETYQTAMRNR